MGFDTGGGGGGKSSGVLALGVLGEELGAGVFFFFAPPLLLGVEFLLLDWDDDEEPDGFLLRDFIMEVSLILKFLEPKVTQY